jgi:hypothetical protein
MMSAKDLKNFSNKFSPLYTKVKEAKAACQAALKNSDKFKYDIELLDSHKSMFQSLSQALSKKLEDARREYEVNEKRLNGIQEMYQITLEKLETVKKELVDAQLKLAAANKELDDANSSIQIQDYTLSPEDAKKSHFFFQLGTAAVVGAAVGFGLSYVPAVTTFVAGLLGAAAATIPPVAALAIVGALVGVLLALAIRFAYDKCNNPASDALKEATATQ